MRDAQQGKLDFLKGAIVIKGKARKLMGAEFVVDSYDGVDFFAAVPIRFKAHPCFKQFDLSGNFWLLLVAVSRVLWSLFCRKGLLYGSYQRDPAHRQYQNRKTQRRGRPRNWPSKGHQGSVGRGERSVKHAFQPSFGVRTLYGSVKRKICRRV